MCTRHGEGRSQAQSHPFGSGTTIQDVNRLVKQFQMMQKMMKQMGRGKMGRKMRMPFMG